MRFNLIQYQTTANYIDLLEPFALTLTSPTDVDTYQPNDTVNVSWSVDNLDVQHADPRLIRIELDRNNAGTFAETIDAAFDPIVGSTTFLATPTIGVPTDMNARLRLVNAQDNTVVATSEYFTLFSAPVKFNIRHRFTVSQ